ncbi:hypothetical protein KORDIASMS9_04517 [Kordia sp. SMS9]|uniref:hypothetical protein n=1 Tax=Kordia sp. SMS9 TaxID=2282170 RepID=UPI000E0DE6AB|nr:hypothetical protein [Kordia sp. SMS9]AXG72248.1 hypothetical protein KORDIASMS9_04517 [Kordia sp. SMS9]
MHDDWKNGKLISAHLYAPRLQDEALSNLVYSSPKASRILSLQLQQKFEAFDNIRGIEMGRQKYLDNHSRLLMVVLSEWYKGNITEVTTILKKMNIYLTTNANLVEKILRYEREIRRFNRIPEWAKAPSNIFIA